MIRQKLIRHATAEADVFIGEDGEITVDSTTHELRLHDGSTPGGHPIPNTGTIPTLSRELMTAVDTIGAPAAIPASQIDKMLTLTAAGTYSLPDRGLLSLGAHFIIYASVAGITLEGYNSGQQIRDKGVAALARPMNQYETLHIFIPALTGSVGWHVLSAY